jgi:hypothetical protein
MLDQRIWSIGSLTLGVLGSLFLSYDLLGKPSGVLRRFLTGITWGLSYALVFALAAIATQRVSLTRTAPLNLDSLWWQIGAAAGTLGLILGVIRGGNTEFSAYADQARLIERLIWHRRLNLLWLLVPLALIFIPLIGYHPPEPWYSLIQITIFLLTFGVLLYVLSALTIGISNSITARVIHIHERWLGAIGALLTLIAFAIQLTLEVLK